MTVTGGTYDSNTGVASFTTNSGNTFNVSGFLTGFTDIYLTGASYNSGTGILSLTNTDGSTVSASGFTSGGGGGIMIEGPSLGTTLRCGWSNTASGDYSTISGGRYNTTYGLSSTISGGYLNTTCGISTTIGGGFNNVSSIWNSTIGGGACNTTLYLACGSVISGGRLNTSSGCYGTINGGRENTTFARLSTIVGGLCNTIGTLNLPSTNGNGSAILGGCLNRITSQQYTFIIGTNITANRSCATFVNNLSIVNVPTSTVGLPVGSVYKDVNGFFKIV